MRSTQNPYVVFQQLGKAEALRLAREIDPSIAVNAKAFDAIRILGVDGQAALLTMYRRRA